MIDQFLLDRDVVFLNHGSFGATPRPVFDVYQQWQRRLEKQPVQLLGRSIHREIDRVKSFLGEYINARSEDLLLVPNATFAVNLLAGSLSLSPGDEILTTSHEYGACVNIWSALAAKQGLKLIRNDISVPLGSPDEVFEEIWSGVTDRTRLIFLSHITSPTAFHLPIEKICAEARKAGILSFIDGAHAPGQISLDLTELGADFYAGNCHKWMLAPKSVGFLHVRQEHHHQIQPLIVSWGWNGGPSNPERSIFQNMQWMGTMDPSAALSIPAAIQFQQHYQWDTIRDQSHAALEQHLPVLTEITGASAYTPAAERFSQMASVPLPDIPDPDKLQELLRLQFSIEIPVTSCQNQNFLRISFQGYNSFNDLDLLTDALESVLQDLT